MSMSTETKVGMFFLMALVALGFMIELVEDWHPFETQLNYHALFNNAVGINPGDPVRMAGVEVGKIRSIYLEEGKVRIDFYVTEGTSVKNDAVAEIRQTNLLGGQFLGITFGSQDSPPLPPGSAISSRERANIDQLITNLDRNQERVLGTLGDLVEKSRQPLLDTISRLEAVTRKMDEGTGTLGRIINDPRLYEELVESVADLRNLLERLDRGEGTLGRLFQDPSLYDETAATVANLREISARIARGEGTLGRLLTDDSLFRNTSEAMVQIRDVTAKINGGDGTLGKLVNDEALYEQARQTLQRLNSIAAKIDEGQGTVGRLVNEDDLYREAKTTLHKVEKTVDGMSDTGPLSALGVVLGTLF